ncbi:MAG: glycogen-binding domain-containing protein [Planctomycetes bacterium]|nr:glycogen-binding domain-containing protein [Planctomycetota bacterium]
MKKQKPTISPTTLTCRAPQAQAVFVAGTFNNWHQDATQLKRADDGTWSVALELPTGHHEFKFIVDGQWCCEPDCRGDARDCPKCVPNDHGTMNRVIEVS